MVKPKVKFRLYGNFNATVNKFLKVVKYILSRVEDMIAAVKCGLHFIKIVFDQAYLQLSVEKKSQELLTINISNRLFQLLKLCMGLSSSPAIWKRIKERI